MTKIVKIKSNPKAVTIKEKKLLLNFGFMKDNIKNLKEQLELMKNEIALVFDRIKTNLIVLVDTDTDYEGFAQKINRKLKRFDVTKFKEENPQLYEKYLVESFSVEYKVEYKLKTREEK